MAGKCFPFSPLLSLTPAAGCHWCRVAVPRGRACGDVPSGKAAASLCSLQRSERRHPKHG